MAELEVTVKDHQHTYIPEAEELTHIQYLLIFDT